MECEYSYLSQLEYILKEQNIEISSKEFEKEVKVNIDISEKDFEILEKKLSRDVKIF